MLSLVHLLSTIHHILPVQTVAFSPNHHKASTQRKKQTGTTPERRDRWFCIEYVRIGGSWNVHTPPARGKGSMDSSYSIIWSSIAGASTTTASLSVSKCSNSHQFLFFFPSRSLCTGPFFGRYHNWSCLFFDF